MQVPEITYLPQKMKNSEKIGEELYEAVKDKVVKSTKGRSSCVFLLHNLDLLDGDYKTKYLEVPLIVSRIRDFVEILSGQIYDYVLVHVYLDDAGIAWHNDKEALNSTVCSISFGQTRKFRLKEIARKTGHDFEFYLASGDVLLMNPGCQKKYFHCVPVQKTVKGIRLNMTFRQYEL